MNFEGFEHVMVYDKEKLLLIGSIYDSVESSLKEAVENKRRGRNVESILRDVCVFCSFYKKLTKTDFELVDMCVGCRTVFKDISEKLLFLEVSEETKFFWCSDCYVQGD